MFDFSAWAGASAATCKLASNWIADWRRMYDFAERRSGRPGRTERRQQGAADRHARRRPVEVPAGQHLRREGGGRRLQRPGRNLAFRNLTRARWSSSRAASRWWSSCSTSASRRAADPEADPQRQERGQARPLTDAEKDIIVNRTPLWFYILREAETGNGKLRGVGARIVAETFHRAMEGSRFSILREPDFRPTSAADDTFEMTDLLFFAFAGKKTGINPLGGP